jgi:hypothetical protein
LPIGTLALQRQQQALHRRSLRVRLQPPRQIHRRSHHRHPVAPALLAGGDGDRLPVRAFLVGALPLSLSTLRSAKSGVMLAAPSSVAFSTSQSMRSLAVMPASRCTARGASRSMAW